MVDACLRRFPRARRVLDLGGGHGEQSLEFARRGLRPTMQDRPEVVEIAERRGQLGNAGVELFAGDLFTTLPPGPFDLVICGLTTNMYDGARNRDLYRRPRPITAPGAWRSSPARQHTSSKSALVRSRPPMFTSMLRSLR